MGRIDYTFKFSTELLVASLSIIVIAANLLSGSKIASANNLFVRLLASHPEQNPQLFAKTSTVKTIVEQDRSTIIPSASAQVVLASAQLATTSAPSNQPSTTPAATLISNNSIQKENPDSVKQMIADQIKVYDTQAGDTIEGIAQRFGVSANTIIWANNLPSENIKPGWSLVILPTTGVLHKVTNNDTLPDIAKKYNADIQQIVSYNGLEDESDIEPGDLLIVPGGTVPAPVAPKKPLPAPAKHVVQGKIVYEPAPGGIEDYDGQDHIFPWGQCTYYVAKKLGGVPWGGNAKNWPANAKAYGATFGSEPVRGSIVVTKENRRYGHVAYVEQVDGDRFLLSEMNYKGLGVISTRWLSVNDPVVRGFIYWSAK